MKKSLMNIITVTVVIVMLFSVSIGCIPDVSDYSFNTDTISRLIPSAEVWSDNFDDEDISDWQLFAVNGTTVPNSLQEGNTSAEGGVMRHDGRLWTYAGHNSSVAFGTWIFDIDIQDPINEFHFSVLFISEIYNDDWLSGETLGDCYCIIFYTYEYDNHDILLSRRSIDDASFHLDSYTTESIIGWKNIIITRELSGQIYVYMDETLILSGKDLRYASSERFYFSSKGGPAIDNVSVSDTIDYDAAPPEWTHPITNQQINLGDSFSYDVNASDYSGIDHWWIDDVENFAINDNGIITSTGNLIAGDYNITVSVNDTLDNIQTDSFVLTVESLLSLPVDLIIAAVGGSIVIIVVLVIWSKRK